MPRRGRREEHICQRIILLKNSQNAGQQRDKLLNAIDTKAPGYEDYVKAMEDLNKKMKEEALKLQKQNGGPVPTV